MGYPPPRSRRGGVTTCATAPGFTQVVVEADAGKELHDLARSCATSTAIGPRKGRLPRRQPEPGLVTRRDRRCTRTSSTIFQRMSSRAVLIEDKIDTREKKRIHYRT